MDWFYNTNFSIDHCPVIIDSYDFEYNHQDLSVIEGYERAGELLGLLQGN